MMRDAAAAGADGLRPARHHRHAVRRRPALRPDPVQARHRWRGGRVPRRVGPAAEPVLFKAFDALPGPCADDVLAVRRRAALARPPARHGRARRRASCRSSRATATGSATPGWPPRPRRSASTPSRSAPPTRSPAVREAFPGDVLVLTPSYPRPFDDATGRVIQTAAHLETVRSGGGARVVVEAMTSMHRHGLGDADVDALAVVAGRGPAGGAGVPPADGPARRLPAGRRGGALAGSARGGRRADRRGVAEPPDGGRAGRAATGLSRPPRSGRGSAPPCGWATARALQARGTVLDVHRLTKGTHYGYRQRRVPRDSHLVVVSGGTAHGVALEAPRTVRGPVGRGKALAVGIAGGGEPLALAVPLGRPAALVRRAAAHARVAAAAADLRASRPRSAPSSTATCASPPCTPTG